MRRHSTPNTDWIVWKRWRMLLFIQNFLNKIIIRKLCLPGGMFLITLPSFRCLLIPKGKICWSISISRQKIRLMWIPWWCCMINGRNILGIIKGMEKVIFWERKGLLYIVSEGMILKKQLFLIWLNHSSSKVIKLTRSRCKPCFSEPGICWKKENCRKMNTSLFIWKFPVLSMMESKMPNNPKRLKRSKRWRGMWMLCFSMPV